MSTRPIGSNWLKNRFKLSWYTLTHNSYEGTRSKVEIAENRTVSEFYPPHYTPEPTPLAHVEFALKYDDFSLDFFHAVFEHISEQDMVHYIQKKHRSILAH